MSLHPGKQVSANLRLVRMLGRGAMGSVWLADHLSLQSQVAVKFMAPAMAEDPISVKRFHLEAKAAAEIRSPHVVQVFDHGQTADGHLFIVMEVLEGESLTRHVRKSGALRPAEVANIVSQVCKALAKAHERGIVHRDIKPSNVFVIDSGGDSFVKVLDFGVAKFTGEEAVTMTAAGNMVGTPAFMSPEQLFHGKDIDHRGDLWSVAIVAYFALTGQRPFRGKTLGELAVQIKDGTIQMPSELREDLPPDLDAWFAKALHQEIGERFSTAKQMAQSLERACGASSLMTSTPSGVASHLQTFPGTSLSSATVPIPQSHDRRRIPLVIGAVAAMAVLGGTAGFLLLRQAPVASAPDASRPDEVVAAPPAPSAAEPPEPVASSAAADGEVVPSSSSEATPSPSVSVVLPSTSAVSRPRQPRPTPRRSPGGTSKAADDDRLKSAADELGL